MTSSAGLGDAFTQAAEQVLARIETLPELYPVVLQEVRRAKLRKFPYVYYRALASRVEVIGVLHGSRNPQLWQDRL
jgi:plasmid stabilization system protein ParE